MKIIQLVLIPLLLLLIVLYFRWLRSRLFDRMIVLLFGITGTVMIAIPTWTTEVAHWVGVGRGADLVIYLGLMGLAFVCLMLVAKLREVERRLAEMVRFEALQSPQKPFREMR